MYMHMHMHTQSACRRRIKCVYASGEAVLGAAFLPMRGATVPLFYFSLRLDVFVSAAEVGAAVGPSVGPGEAAVAAAAKEEEEAARQERGKGEAERGGVTSMERQEQERAVVAQGEGWEAANAAIEALSLDERVAGWSLPREGQSANAALQASSLAVGACALCLPASELHARCMCTACAHYVCTSRRALHRGRLQTGQLTGRVWTIRTRRSWPMLRPCGAQQLCRARRAPRQRCHPDAVRRPRKRRARRARRVRRARWARRARRRRHGSLRLHLAPILRAPCERECTLWGVVGGWIACGRRVNRSSRENACATTAAVTYRGMLYIHCVKVGRLR